MKRITLLTITAFLLIAYIRPAAAQNLQGQVAINGGVGYSLITAFVEPGDALSNIHTIWYRFPPGPAYVLPSHTQSEDIAYSGGIDYALTRVFSMGLAGTYQATYVYWTNWTNSETGNYENFTETITRLNMGLRILGHMGIVSDRYDIYAGFRVGYSRWTDANNSNDTAFEGSKRDLNFPSFQFLLGFRGYFTSFMGVQAELAAGTPYFCEAGLVFKFGGKRIAEPGNNTGNKTDANDPYAKERRARDSKK